MGKVNAVGAKGRSGKLARLGNRFEIEVVPLARLKPHPRNYKKHSPEQLAHIEESLLEAGFYRAVVVARDYTILSGHGLVMAAKRLGVKHVPAKRLPIAPGSSLALKIVVNDNELGRFAESDDIELTELLRDITKLGGTGLLGTGYDEQMLAALVLTTRPSSEISSFDAAAEWVGMPEYDVGGLDFKVIFNFDSEEDRRRFLREYGFEKHAMTAGSPGASGVRCLRVRWPFRPNMDSSAIKFVDAGAKPRRKERQDGPG